MIEVHVTCNIRPDVDEQAYFACMKKGVVPALQSPGMIEVRAHRHAEKSDLVPAVSKWDTLEHWKNYSRSEHWKSLLETLRQDFAENIHMEVWNVSQLILSPIHPPK